MTEIDHARIARVFAAQRANRLALKRRSAAERIAVLQNLRAEITRRQADIDEALHQDMRRPRQGAQNRELLSTLGEIDLAINGLEEWMKPEPIEPSPYFKGNDVFVQYEPRGVVLLLGPWNFPFSLIFAPLVPIIAAGNAALIKPNEMQPLVSTLVREIVEAVFPENEVAVFEGGIPLAEALQDLPFDHVFFTGSPAVGKRVMAAAARHLSTVTLELGGKCPAIIGADYDLLDAAGKIVGARFLNGGQLCLSVDHVWVPKAQQAALLQLIGAIIEKMFFVEGELQLDRLPRMVDARNFARVKGYIEEAVARGATLVRGGQSDAATLTIAPTVIADPPLDTALMLNEIFGPVLPVIGYDDIGEALAQIDATGKPLAMYIFSKDDAFTAQVLEGSSSGGVTVNHVMMHYAESKLPFGGVNGSGIGRYKGVHGFRELSNARSVFVQRVGV